MEDGYLNDFHRKNCEACIAAVERMKKHPLSSAEVTAQMKRNHEAAMAQGNGSPHLIIYDVED